MHQFDDSQALTQQPYEAQIRARILEGSLAPGSPARKLLMPQENAARTYKFQSHHFRGKLEVPGMTTLPEQDFSFHFNEGGGYIKNHPEDHWPSIRIDITFSPLNEFVYFQVDSADNTVDAGLLFTRLNFALYIAGKFCLQGKDGERILEFGIDKPSPTIEEGLFFRAKLFRKLKFIESVFKTKFLLPLDYSYNLELVELAFRGITEGEVTIRKPAITFYDYKPSSGELNNPPFTGAGSISHTFKHWNLVVFDRVLRIGPVSVHLDHAVVANPRVLDKLRAGEIVSQIRFIIFDHQIRLRFEEYATLSPQTRRRKLRQFKKKLLKEEPEALVALLDEPLTPDVSADEASQIVMGWLQFYHFPDRYCPQEPKLEEDRWRVPIWITYPHGQGAWVQDAFVNLKTGVVTVPVSVEELRNLGKAVAAECLRAS